MQAIRSNNIDKFQRGILMGEDVNCRNEMRQTPLHLCCEFQRETLLMILLKQQAFPNVVDVNGLTPLHVVAMQNDANSLSVVRIMESLVNFDAKVNAQSKDGSTPLHLAC